MSLTNEVRFIKDVVNRGFGFANKYLKAYNPEHDLFVYKLHYKDEKNINLDYVVGTDHPDYVNTTWLAALKNLKRFTIIFNDVKHDQVSFEGMSFTKLNGRYFIQGDGNHRTIFLRFYNRLHNEKPIIDSKVRVMEVTRNERARKMCLAFEKKLKKLKINTLQIKVEKTLNKALNRNDEIIQYFNTEVYLVNIKNLKKLKINTMYELEFYIDNIERLKGWRKLFLNDKLKRLKEII